MHRIFGVRPESKEFPSRKNKALQERGPAKAPPLKSFDLGRTPRKAFVCTEVHYV